MNSVFFSCFLPGGCLLQANLEREENSFFEESHNRVMFHQGYSVSHCITQFYVIGAAGAAGGQTLIVARPAVAGKSDDVQYAVWN